MPPSADKTPQPNVTAVELSPRLWIAVVLTGAGAGLAGGLLMKLLRLAQHLSFRYSVGDFLSGVSGVSGARRLEVMTLAGVGAALVLTLLHRFGKGGDIDEAIWLGDGQLPLASTSWRALLSIVTVGMGVALGREGALKQAGAVVANKVCDWSGLSRAQRQLLVACGAGAGMAAAYNVPLGGSLFTAEVLLGTLQLAAILPAFAACFTAVAVSWLLLPNEPAYRIPELHATHSLVLWSVLAGPLLGLVSIVYVRAIGWADTHKPRGWQVAAFPLATCIGLGALSMRYPQMLGNGKNIVQLTFEQVLPAALLVALVFLRPLASAMCLRSGLPGGLFTPTMTLGALLGDGLGRLWSLVALPGSVPGDVAAYALVGSGAFLAAATLGPLSSAAFLLELTHNADTLMVPLLISTVGATVTARAIEIRSIYSARIPV